MDREVAALATVAVGGLIALQAPVNSVLGHRIGTFQASALSFLIGTVALALIALFVGGFANVGEARHVPLIYLTGGLLGAAYVTCVLVTVRSLGVAGATAATIAGQLAASVVIDHFGLLSVARQPVTALKVLGIALLAAGTWLVIRD